MGGKIIINGFIKPFSDNEQLSEVGNGKIPLPARWQFGVFGGPKKAYAGFPVWMEKNDNLSLLSALKSRFPNKLGSLSANMSNHDEGSGWQVIPNT